MTECVKRAPGRATESTIVAAVVSFMLALAHPSRADINPNSGIDFARIGAVGNQPWMGTNPQTPGDRAVGRGAVGYEYHMGRFEVTTAQWVEFYNAAYARPVSERLPHISVPDSTFWGGQSAPPTTPGHLRWTVRPGQDMHAVGMITWRTAGMYANWLHNGKSTARESFLSGAYEVSSFGTNGMGGFSDQSTRSPGARYWIPSLDEWMKAAHYDPNKDGPGQAGWWLYNYTSDERRLGGLPGIGNGNYGNMMGGYDIPLGAYPSVTSPWGLLDTAGATCEWTEDILESTSGPRFRVFKGSFWDGGPSGLDSIVEARSADYPNVPAYYFGLRIASSVPSPGAGALGLGVFLYFNSARRRRPSSCPSSTFGGPSSSRSS